MYKKKIFIWLTVMTIRKVKIQEASGITWHKGHTPKTGKLALTKDLVSR